MALKTSNKNRKKVAINDQITDSVTQSNNGNPNHVWWWLPDSYKFYVIGVVVLAFVVLLA
jgi:hypothetical protein